MCDVSNVLTQTNSSTCFICNGHRPSIKTRVQIFIARDIYIPEYVRCCPAHLDDKGNIYRCLLPGLRFIRRSYVIKGTQLMPFLQGLRDAANNHFEYKFNDENSFSDDEFKCLTSLTKEQFRELFTFCALDPELVRQRHATKKHLLTFLCKLRQGLSDEFLTVTFNYSCRQNTSMAITVVRQLLMKRFVPSNIGFAAITRQQYIERYVTDFTNALYNPEPNDRKAIAYIDGTYSKIEKSSNFRVLQQSYCVHKGHLLLKPYLIVAPDGYILAILGLTFQILGIMTHTCSAMILNMMLVG